MAKHGNELVIALVGALGTDLEMVQGLVESAMDEVGYNCKTVRLSDLIRSVPGYPLSDKASSDKFDEKVEALMDAGTGIRQALGGNALAKLAVLKMRALRYEERGAASNEDSSRPLERTAYILRSLKNPDEVKFLREIYGDSFFLFSAYCPKRQRITNLAHDIRQSRHRHRMDEFEARAIELLQKDEEEPDNRNGQHVRRTFWKGDAFINASTKDSAKAEVHRIVRLWFGHPYTTPSRDEFAMFCARAASFRSASMGRQVGAAISDSTGAVIASGTNEIPRAGGGHYWDGDEPDGRDHKRGSDSSDTMIRELLEDALSRLMDIGWSAPTSAEGKSITDQVAELLRDPKMEGAEFQSLMEYMRPVHAEMSAISDAARRGVPIAGTSLYCTAFPCHSCARHIVAVGISRVVYIEPYAKSLVKTLYDDSIMVDEGCDHEAKVRFEPFIGVAPRRYLEFFEMGERKDQDGKVIDWKATDAMPRIGGWEDWLSVEKENRYLETITQELNKAKEKWQSEQSGGETSTNTDAGVVGAAN